MQTGDQACSRGLRVVNERRVIKGEKMDSLFADQDLSPSRIFEICMSNEWIKAVKKIWVVMSCSIRCHDCDSTCRLRTGSSDTALETRINCWSRLPCVSDHALSWTPWSVMRTAVLIRRKCVCPSALVGQSVLSLFRKGHLLNTFEVKQNTPTEPFFFPRSKHV